MLIGSIAYPEPVYNIINYINDNAPVDVIAYTGVTLEGLTPEQFTIIIDDIHVDIQVDNLEGLISLSDTIITEAGNHLECHIHLEDLTIEELIAECINWYKRHDQDKEEKLNNTKRSR